MIFLDLTPFLRRESVLVPEIDQINKNEYKPMHADLNIGRTDNRLP